MEQDYEKFVEKFKPKKTTDDCHTPPAVYEVVKNWAVKEYRLEDCTIVRPFFPDGEYENFDYPENCVVIDNPPFSIASKIWDFYNARGIKFFLFANHLTLFSHRDNNTNFVVTSLCITYENGAKVNTSFATNLGTTFIRTAPELVASIKNVMDSCVLEKYKYPSNVISASLLGKIRTYDFTLTRNECSHIRQLDAQKESKKQIFGTGYLISDKKAAELSKLKAIKEAETTHWMLSNREKDIILTLK